MGLCIPSPPRFLVLGLPEHSSLLFSPLWLPSSPILPELHFYVSALRQVWREVNPRCLFSVGENPFGHTSHTQALLQPGAGWDTFILRTASPLTQRGCSGSESVPTPVSLLSASDWAVSDDYMGQLSGGTGQPLAVASYLLGICMLFHLSMTETRFPLPRH